jgi:cytochrome c oxidase subunit 1
MALAAVFSLFAGTYYWFPLMTAQSGKPGRMMSETLGRLHFWGTLLGAYATFLPMHLTGLMGEPRHYAQLTGVSNAAGHLLAGTLPLNRFITWSAIFLSTAQLFFFANLLYSLFRGRPAPPNPWQATTLEWHPAMHPNFSLEASETVEKPIAVYRQPCQYQPTPTGELFLPQWSPDAIQDIKPE